MNTILRQLFKWIGSKIITLLGIIAVLLVGLWFRSEWGEISKVLKAASVIDQRISEKESEISRLRREAEKHGSAAVQAIKNLESLDKITKDAEVEADEAEKTFNYWSGQVGWYQYWFEDWKVKKKAEAWVFYEAKQKIADGARASADTARKVQQNSPWTQIQSKLDADQKDLDLFQAERDDFKQTAAKTPSQRLILAVREVLPSALWILVGVIVIPVGIKALLFFLVAPLADKVRPIKIIPNESAPTLPPSRISSVSLDAEISAHDELLVHPDYLQSVSKSAKTKTKWFLNHRLPFSSLASGMCLLTRIRAQEDSNETVKISPTKDPLGEVALIELPVGAAMVLFPRSLAAVIKTQDQDILITRCWRVKSLHSWLTLQFRYLVFHGPCKLIVTGCRGVCVEKPEPTKPRLISQAATIGFSANLDYSNSRSEVFLSYLRGKDDLFNDLFGGETGIFMYEEMPDLRRKTGFTGSGLEGLTDALLKAFGI